MNMSLFACVLCLVPAAVLAADASGPVKELIDAAAANSAENPSRVEDYFSKDRLARLYSKDFVARYREASKHPAYDGSSSPFDYDVIAGGQDGCPFKNISIAAKGFKDGATDVVARFKNTYCLGEDAAQQGFTELHFRVIEENGRAVVDDMRNGARGDASLKKTMAAIARGG